MPLFSVVIPAYNAKAYIPECLDSVRVQSFTDYEVVVVDDGSEDGTGGLVQDWASRNSALRLRLVRQENRGIGSARNTGVRGATGKFIAFLDSDDSWLPKKLERVAEFISEHGDADLVCHDEWLAEEAHPTRTLRYGPYTAYEDLLFKRNCISTSATVVRSRNVLAVGGFSENPRFNGAEDYDLWLRLAKAGCRFAYLHEVLGRYRVHKGGTTRKAEEYCEHTLGLLAVHFGSFPEADPRYRSMMRRRRAGALRGAGRLLMKQGDRVRAQQYLRKAIGEDPLSWKNWGLALLNTAHLSV